MTKIESDEKDILNEQTKQVKISKTKKDSARYKLQNTGQNFNKCDKCD